MKHTLSTGVRTAMALLGLAGLLSFPIFLSGVFEEGISFAIIAIPITAITLAGSTFLLFCAYTGVSIQVTDKVIRIDKFCFRKFELCTREVAEKDVTKWGFHEYIWGRLVLISTKPSLQSLNIHYEYYQHPEQLKADLAAFLDEEKRAYQSEDRSTGIR